MPSIINSLLLSSTAAFAAEFLTIPLSRSDNTNSLQKRTVLEDGVSTSLEFGNNNYLATFLLGGQEQTAILDTGSADLWVYSEDSGAEHGFDPSGSELIGHNFSIGYLGSSASGDWFRDYISWGGANVSTEFGVAYNYSAGYYKTGILGVALEPSAAQTDYDFPSYPYRLKKEGYTDTVSYSLALNGPEGNGTLLFGAIDKSKYVGKLKELDMHPNTSYKVNFEVSDHKLQGVLDTGSQFVYLPDDIVKNFAHANNATWDSNKKMYVSTNEPNSNFIFDFEGKKIAMQPSDLWSHFEGDTYLLNVRPWSQIDNTILLGDPFMRSAYIVYDIDHRKIAVAQLEKNPGSPEYMPITSDDGIPDTSD